MTPEPSPQHACTHIRSRPARPVASRGGHLPHRPRPRRVTRGPRAAARHRRGRPRRRRRRELPLQYALEFGFTEGFPLDTWVGGAGRDDDLPRLCEVAIPWGVTDSLRWLRQHNRTAAHPVRFAGIDVPEAGASLLPGLAQLPAAEQDALSAVLARLLIRFRSVEPLHVTGSDQRSCDVALRRLEGACHTDYHFRAMADLCAGRGLAADTSAREVYLAGSVRWHPDHSDPGTRIVLAAHNAHIQKAPVTYDGRLTALPMGQHLDRLLGEDYVALGLTSGVGQTAEMHLDPTAPFGFTVTATALDSPEPGSIEAAFTDAELGLALADLRRAPRSDGVGPDRFRMHSSYMYAPALDAFDGMINLPRSTVADDIGF